MKAQKTTSRRSHCTVSQRSCWRKTVDKALELLHKKDTGVYKKSGKSFGKLIEHFVIGCDETCLIVDANGDVKIICKFVKAKQEKLAGDCRASCTMYR